MEWTRGKIASSTGKETVSCICEWRNQGMKDNETETRNCLNPNVLNKMTFEKSEKSSR